MFALRENCTLNIPRYKGTKNVKIAVIKQQVNIIKVNNKNINYV